MSESSGRGAGVLKHLLSQLVQRRPQPHRWIVVGGAMAFATLAFISGEPAGALLFAVPVALSLVQVVYPTFLGWVILSGFSALIGAAFVASVVFDLYRCLVGQVAYVMTSFRDSAILVGTAVTFLAIAVGFVIARPK